MSKQYPIELFESAQDHADVIPPELAKPANFRRKSNILSIAACVVVLPGLLATMVLPAYGAAATETTAQRASIAMQEAIADHSQRLSVDSTATADLTVARDKVSYIEPPAPIVVHHVFTGLAQSYGSIDITGVAAIAAKYLGVPYVFGGESTSGFDCSGLVEYVYAQVGISLPHSSRLQGQMGTRVSVASAVPGDVVVMDGGSHVGIYVGGGHMIDAPYPGRVVSVDAIYDNNYWIVHF